MPIYKCEFCKFQTEKKTDFQRHKDRKVPCTLSQLAKRETELETKIEIIVEERLKAKELLQMAAAAVPNQLDVIIDQTKNLILTPQTTREEAITQPAQIDVTILMTLNKRIHNMIRNFQGNLKSDKVHHDVSRMFFYVFAQNYYDTRLAALFDLRYYTEVDGFEECYLKLLRINEILASENAVIEHNLKNLWKKVLAQHPLTKPAFIQADFFLTTPELVKVCLFEIYKTVRDINFDMLNEDIKGKIFEYYVNEYSNSDSNDFGAYFTPRPLIKATLSLIKTLYPSFAPMTAYDPCMGTAGFLIEGYRHFKESLDKGYVYGNELEPDTFTSAYMNTLLSINKQAWVWCIDSYTDTTPNQFQLIITNPPFGGDINCDKIIENCNEQNRANPTKFSGDIMYPIKINDKGALFLQHCMAKLAPGGVCSIVLPNGKMSTKTGAFSDIRQYLMAKFYIMSIVTVPGGVFTNTDVKTIILTFANIGYPTQSIKFYEYVNGENKFQEEITLNRIIEKKYSWQYGQYRPFENIANVAYPVVKLGDICDIKNGTRVNKGNLKDGIYPVIAGGKEPMGMHDTYNVESGVICISRKGTAGYVQMTETKTFVHDNASYLANIKEQINSKYLYHYLKTVQDQIYELVGGSGSPGLTKDNIYNIPIPVPSLEKQIEIANSCDEIINIKKSTEKENEFNQKQMEIIKQHLAVKALVRYPYVVKKLDDVSFIRNGTRITKTEASTKEQKYPVYGGGNETFMTDTFNRSGETCKISRFGVSRNSLVTILNKEYFLNDSGFTITSLDHKVMLDKYLWYYLSANIDNIYNICSGAAQQNINMDSFKELPIFIPSIEDQHKIINEFETIVFANTNTHIERIKSNEKYIELLDSEIKVLFQ